MNRSMLRIVALSASLLAAGTAVAQSSSSSSTSSSPITPPKTGAPAAAPAEKQQRLVKVAVLVDAAQNREFQANVQFMQSQRQQVVELNSAWEKETNPAKKKELRTQLDALLAKLTENNDKMLKAYGFSITRNYTMEIEKSSIYMLVTDEEAAQLEKDQAAAAAKQPAKK